MDPYDVIIPTNLLVASPEPHTVPIARCDCGFYDCGSTDITITRRGDLVHWDWLYIAPINRGVSFNAADYDREITRIASDHSWETPARTAGRLILAEIDRKHLSNYGLAPHWVSHDDYRHPEQFRVALWRVNEYQVFVDTPWLGRSPEQLASLGEGGVHDQTKLGFRLR
jgi:hypothetical protein